MNNPRSSRPDHGMTLVELLVALAIGAIIMTLVLVAYRAFSRNESRQFERISLQSNADGIIDFLRQDLQQLFLPAGDQDGAIELDNSPTNLTRLAFCRWQPVPNKNGLMTNRLERVEFKYADVGGKNGLIRLSQSLTGPGSLQPAATNWSGYRWPRLQVQLYDGTAWQTNWPAGGKARPMAARIFLWRDGVPEPFQEALVLIPSGLNATSQIQRTAVSPGS